MGIQQKTILKLGENSSSPFWFEILINELFLAASHNKNFCKIKENILPTNQRGKLHSRHYSTIDTAKQHKFTQVAARDNNLLGIKVWNSMKAANRSSTPGINFSTC